MFKRLNCFWMVFVMIVSSSVRAEEDKSSYPFIPEQYFAWDWKDARWGDASAVFWPTLFPENPPFNYACLYLGSFDQEWGFYLDGNTLYWAHSTGAQSRQMLDQKPIVNLQTGNVSRGASLVAFLWTPTLRSLAGVWDWILKKNPFHLLGNREDQWRFPTFRDRVMMAGSRGESLINPFLYSRYHVRRGHAVLKPALADALRRTWDESVAKRTFFMSTYRALVQGTDGNYCYFRGGSGPVSEDLCMGGGKMRCSMMDLAHGLMDIMMMDDLKPETEHWLMEQCALVRRESSAIGDEAPPMVSDQWAQDFADRYFECPDRDGEKKEEKKDEHAFNPESALPETEEEVKQPEKPEPDKKEFAGGYRKRFFKPLEENPLWDDLFPKGSEGKPAALWFMEWGPAGIYIDGAGMVRAFARNVNPEQIYRNHFFRGIPERRLCPYEGETEENMEYNPRVRREWMALGDELSECCVMILNRIARGEIPALNISGNPEADEISVIVARGADGATRIISSGDSGAGDIIKFLEAVYYSYESSGAQESIQVLREYHEMLQGKEPKSERCREATEDAVYGRYLW